MLLVDVGLIGLSLVALYYVLTGKWEPGFASRFTFIAFGLLALLGEYYGDGYAGIVVPVALALLLIHLYGWDVAFYASTLYGYSYGLTMIGNSSDWMGSLALGLVYSGFVALFSVSIHVPGCRGSEKRCMSAIVYSGFTLAAAYVLYIFSAVAYISRVPDHRVLYGFPVTAAVSIIEPYAGILASLVYVIVAGMWLGVTVGLAALMTVGLVLLLYVARHSLLGGIGDVKPRVAIAGLIWSLISVWLMASPPEKLKIVGIVTGLGLYNFSPVIYYYVFGRLILALGVILVEFLLVAVMWPSLGQLGFLAAGSLLAAIVVLKRLGVARILPYIVAGLIVVGGYTASLRGEVKIHSGSYSITPGTQIQLHGVNCTLDLTDTRYSNGWAEAVYSLQDCDGVFWLKLSDFEWTSEPALGYTLAGSGCVYAIDPAPSPTQRAEVQLWLLTGTEPRLEDAPVELMYREVCGVNWVVAATVIILMLPVARLVAVHAERIEDLVRRMVWRLGSGRRK
ncbi:hypothetical protein [Pyrodictium delaneyi]|uniref:Uncharacterized protein n=1 Tax=Pyrodictium delaneyi TaxID=1273541 RepID=A0A211YN23_9CREN|nr:hypothetical protein [Pyrodictium delaneyi]OWJ54379.1 hypothetical protein Pdsh_07860 [Pyrodictium delaneyi]